MTTDIMPCTGCEADVEARLTDGREIYPHRPDLAHLPFWKCDRCKNFVGCHHKTANRTKPLGPIPTEGIRRLRATLHAKIDPLWKNGSMSRSQVYKRLAKELGISEFHVGWVISYGQAQQVKTALESITRIPN